MKLDRKVTSQPRKSRKVLYTMKPDMKRKIMCSKLSEELRQNYKRRSVPIRSEDYVKIVTGSAKGKFGTVKKVNVRKGIVYINELTRNNTRGTNIHIGVHPSNLIVYGLGNDAKRKESLYKKSQQIKN